MSDKSVETGWVIGGSKADGTWVYGKRVGVVKYVCVMTKHLGQVDVP